MTLAMTALLCPLHIPTSLVLAGPVFLVCSALLPFLVIYHLYWLLMYSRAPTLGAGIRVRGRVTGPGPRHALVFGRDAGGRLVARPFFVNHHNTEVMVDPEGALLRGWPRRVRVGDVITVDGLHVAVALPGERLYRDCSTRPGLAALQIVRGAPPRLRALKRLVVICWAVSLAVIFFSIFFL